MAPGGVPGQASVGPAAGVASTGANTLLWAKTQQLPEEAFRQLHSIYGDHFPIEARHHLAGNHPLQIISWEIRKKFEVEKLKEFLLLITSCAFRGFLQTFKKYYVLN